VDSIGGTGEEDEAAVANKRLFDDNLDDILQLLARDRLNCWNAKVEIMEIVRKNARNLED
jgi:hypothetical protein